MLSAPLPFELLELQRAVWAAQRAVHACVLGAPVRRADWPAWQEARYWHLKARQAEAERRLLDHPVMRDAIAERKWARTAQALQRAARAREGEQEPEPVAA